ncbi:MAG: AlpA family phage regulatory protein [Burkholderiaceae bacterium]
MEQRGEFPKRFRLTVRCVVWDLEEVSALIEERTKPRAQRSSAHLSARMSGSACTGPSGKRSQGDPASVLTSCARGTLAPSEQQPEPPPHCDPSPPG